MADNFLIAVQNSKIKQPTQRGFSEKKWRDQFALVDSPSDADRRIYEAGIWFDQQLTEIRNCLKNLQNICLPDEKIIQMYVAHVNRSFKVGAEALKESIKAKDNVTVNELIEGKLPIGPNGYEMNPADVVESLVSAIRYPLSEIMTKGSGNKLNNGDKKSLKLLSDLLTHSQLAILYDEISSFWADCLWNGWRIEEKKDLDLIAPPSEIDYIRRVVGEYRLDAQAHEMTFHTMNYWKGIPEYMKEAELSKLRIVGITRNKKKKKIELGSVGTSEMPPPAFTAKVLAMELYWREMILQPMPKLNGVTIRELLSVWDLLASLGEVLDNKLPENTAIRSIKQLFDFAPYIPVNEVYRCIQETTELSLEKIKIVLDLFIFNGKVSDDPWKKPLIRVDDKNFVVIVPALVAPNLLRSVEEWMKIGGLKLEERGESFELHFRTEISNIVCKSKFFKTSKIENGTSVYKCHGGEEEIDFLWLMDSVLLVGEIKCSIYPATPIERHNYFCTLNNAVDQVIRKTIFVKKNQKEMLQKLGAESSRQVTVYPLIISNLALGAGFPIGGVPIIDLPILSSYLDGEQEFFVQTQWGEKGQAKKKITYFSSKEEAEIKLFPYLCNPPYITFIASLLDKEVRPILQIKNHRPRSFIRLYVKPQPIDKTIDKFSELNES